jgi:MFS family permease
MTVLILGRMLHGIGGGGLTSTAMVVLGDVAAPKDRARYYAYFAATYTTAGACGPLLGGVLSEYVHWSAIFWLNIPLGLIAIFFTLRVMRGLPRHEHPHKLDFLGAALIVVATISFMFSITAGGVRFPWT